MPVVCFNEENFSFPALSEADEEGLLMIGGRVTPARVLEAYRQGIFPWYSGGEPPLWWSPDPRFVLFPDELHVSRSMKKLLSKAPFEWKMDTAFEEVMEACATVKRQGQDGTWITPEIKQAYTELHHQGYAHSSECWRNGKLVGGVYGIRLSRVFFGESMFSRETNASKAAFIQLVQHMQKDGVELVDCQVYTEHVESLGGRLIQREEYVNYLKDLTPRNPCP